MRSRDSHGGTGASGGAPAASAPGGARPAVEWALRALVLVVLAWLLWRATRPPAPPPAVRATAPALRERLPAWTRAPEVRVAHAELAGVPSDTVRDWLAALAHAGVRVSYGAPALAPVAVAVEPVADPAGRVRLLAAAPGGTAVVLGDALGVLDSVRAGPAGATLATRTVAGVARAAAGNVAARGAAPGAPLLRPVLVLGTAGWESKFTIAALEERGWTVLARLAVAPDVAVTQGAPPALDTARLAAVVALDSAARPYAARIARYVRQGGGLVLAPPAAALPELAALAPARLDAPVTPHADALAGPDPRAGVPRRPLFALRDGAVAIEERDGRPAVAAWRVGAGRVVLSGYDETWRWRMAGPDGAPAAHRAWWAGLLAAAAYAPVVPDSGAGAPAAALDDAPVARLLDALGAPSSAPPAAAAREPRPALPWWVFPLVVLALLAEWASRRARGRR
ncbi:MAG TPA: hypothetical protein VFS08_13145 [Gemmatimonadaceae bacterium]|nr:hypothetical protein [Gemmatimonadaceae bacterium]